MKKINLHIEPQNWIDYKKSYTFIGSCFSENLSKKMIEDGFQVKANPLGVIFNPISIADFFLLNDNQLEESVFIREDVALSWLANSTFFSYDKEELKAELLVERAVFLESIKSSGILFVTFGTAWVYEHIASDTIVANCHKASANQFVKRLITLEEIVESWQYVIDDLCLNTDLKIVFTVSPVRHIKDGLVENNRSKARLLEAVHLLAEKNENVAYFPAYELVLDVLRDYSFFEKDGVHPNQTSIDEVWDIFKQTYFTKETIELNQELNRLKQLFRHRPLHPNSKQAVDFVNERNEKWKNFINQNSFFKDFIIE